MSDGDQASSGSDPAWPDPSKSSLGHNPYDSAQQGYGPPASGPPWYGSPGYAPPPHDRWHRPSTGILLGLAALLAAVACAIGLFIAYLL
jgi:hypothetical protein